MLMLLIAELSIWGFKYHDRKADNFTNVSKEFAYHVYMAQLYTGILGETLASDKLRKKYLK